MSLSNKVSETMLSEWELYNNKDGWEVAEIELNESFGKMFSNILSDMLNGLPLSMALKNVNDKMHSVMLKHEKYGACDSEPRVILARKMAKLCEERFDIQNQEQVYNMFRYGR